MSAAQDLFKGLSTEDSSDRRGWLTLGIHTVKMVRCVQSKTRKGADLIVLEFDILKSTDPEIHPGSARCQVIKCSWDSWKRHYKGFLKAVFESKSLDPEGITDEEAARVVSGDGTVLAGLVLRCEVSNTIRKDGGNFSIHSWSAPDDTPTQAPVLQAGDPFDDSNIPF